MTATRSPEVRSGVDPQVRWALFGVLLAMLLSMLDNTIVGTSMPTIVKDLGGLAQISWVVSGYTLATAVSTPVWGKFGDLFGRKLMYLLSIALFLAGSVLSGASQSMIQLIVFRIIQGLGAGGIGAGAFALIAALVAPRERGRYQGMTASIMAIGTIAGPLLGGVIVDTAGWRWAFYINIPLGLFALIWCWLRLKVPQTRFPARIDWAGIAVLTVTISSLVLAGNWAGSTYSWGSWQIVGLFAVSAFGIGLFILIERRVSEPLIPLRIFEHRNYGLAAVMILTSGASLFAATLYIPLFQQTVQGVTASSSGLLLLPLMLPVAFVSQIVGRVMSKTGRYKMFPVIGGALLTVGMGLLATMTVNTPPLLTSAYMVLVGLGIGCIFQMTTTIAQNSVDMKDIGAASATVNLFRTLGGSVGVAVFGALLTGATGATATPSATGATATGVSTRIDAAARDAYLQATTTGMQHIFLLAAIGAVAAFIAAMYVIEVPLRSGRAELGTEKPASGTPALVVPDARPASVS